MMISNMISHVLSIMLFLFQCVNSSTSTTIPTFLGNQQLVAKADKQMIKCIDKERHALLDFKAMILRDPFDRLSTWGTKKEDDCCNWDGVMCDEQTGHVTDLNLNSGYLEGEISLSLLNLTYLTSLYLESNSFAGSIPKSICSLIELRYLDLSDNAFNGTIPKCIGSMTELRFLDLSSNSFSGNIPPEFGDLVNLEYLDLNDTGRRCSVENISWLSRLSRLENLNMNGISLAKADHWVNAILSLQNLTTLHLEGCDLSKVMLPYSSSSHLNFSSSNIHSLDLSSNNLNSSMYPWLYPLTRSNKLQTLDLSGNKLDEFPTYLGNLCSLIDLYLANNSALVAFSDFMKTLSAGCTSDTLVQLIASSSQFTGSISDDIQNFSSLAFLFLDDNQLNGSISEKIWELPMLYNLDISFNSFTGSIFEKSGKPKLTYPKFKNRNILGRLNIANSVISDTIPMDFWDTLSSLSYLNLSSNNISGKAPYFLPRLEVLDLSSNNFHGPVTNVSSNLFLLNLSKNKFYGGISFLCQNIDLPLTYLDLSYNSFSGQIPDCLWHLKNLKVLNLAHNKLSGRLPASVQYLIELDVLVLYNNNLSGELPLSLRNCTILTFLDLGGNKFSGSLPVWIGENLSGLYVLSLGSNDFFGPIPQQFCHLVNLQILDLSMNNLNGTIPSCVNNLTSMVRQGFLSANNVHEYSISDFTRSAHTSYYIDRAMIQWQGTIREFTSNLGLLKSIDVSSNNLTGEIPKELTDLRGLLALNLSKNALLGEIPWAIGEMKVLLMLDISRNKFTGEIPSSMSQMTFLYGLDISYNNLSGRIPSSTQLQSFEPSRYTGNVGLCGPPLTKSCPGDVELHVPYSSVVEREGGGEDDEDELDRWFYIGGAIGFAVGFWIVCCTLLAYRHGRHTFFHFMDGLENWVYVKVVVFKAKFQRIAQ